MLQNIEKAHVLIEALPYMQRYYGKTIVIKYGGNAMINEELKDAVMRDIILLSCVGIKVVLVHGGGPEISEMLKRVGKESRFINGLRYSDEETVEIVQMVLAGKLNKDLVGQICTFGGKALGLCGLDGGMLKAKKLEGEVDYGNVGDITSVDISPIKNALNDNYIPVIATLGMGSDGTTYNINADDATAKIAVALRAEKLMMLTDIRGVMRDPKDESTLISKLAVDEISKLIEDGAISGGMIPKLNCCVESVMGGVSRAHIIDGRIPHSVLIEMFSDEGIGTMVW